MLRNKVTERHQFDSVQSLPDEKSWQLLSVFSSDKKHYDLTISWCISERKI